MRFEGFEGEWEETFLEKILSIGNGRDYKHLKQGCVPVFGTGGYMISVNDYLYDGESVFIGRKGTINKPFYYNGKFWTVDTLFYTYNYKNVTPKFVYCLFQTINWLKYNEASGVPSLSKSTIEKIKVKVPSIEEQIKISRLLLLLDERIATQNKIIEKLQSLIKGIVVTHYDKCQNKQTIKISELGKHFNVGLLSKEDLAEEGTPCILYGELFTTYNCVANIIESKTKKTDNQVLSIGDELLFPASTTVDAVSLITPTALTVANVVLGGDMFGIHVRKEYNAIYVSYILNYIFKQHLAKYAQGSTIIHLHYKDVENLRLSLPALEKQMGMVNILNLLQKKIENEQRNIRLLMKLRSFLLSELFI